MVRGFDLPRLRVKAGGADDRFIWREEGERAVVHGGGRATCLFVGSVGASFSAGGFVSHIGVFCLFSLGRLCISPGLSLARDCGCISLDGGLEELQEEVQINRFVNMLIGVVPRRGGEVEGVEKLVEFVVLFCGEAGVEGYDGCFLTFADVFNSVIWDDKNHICIA